MYIQESTERLEPEEEIVKNTEKEFENNFDFKSLKEVMHIGDSANKAAVFQSAILQPNSILEAEITLRDGSTITISSEDLDENNKCIDEDILLKLRDLLCQEFLNKIDKYRDILREKINELNESLKAGLYWPDPKIIKEAEKALEGSKDESTAKEEISQSDSKDNVKLITVPQNIDISKDELNKLIEKFGEDFTQRCVDYLSTYKREKNKFYKSDYQAINGFVVQRIINKQTETLMYDNLLLPYADNVLMTKVEYRALVDEFGKELTDKCIEYLSKYKKENSREYQSDYSAIKSFVVARIKE